MQNLVLGASSNANRYSYNAVVQLLHHGYSVIAFGNSEGTIQNLPIITQWNPNWNDIHTLTIYVNPTILQDYIDSIIKLSPKRIIFNPGTESLSAKMQFQAAGIEVEEACTLVLLATGQYD